MQSYIIFNLFLLTCIIVLAICFKSYAVKNKKEKRMMRYKFQWIQGKYDLMKRNINKNQDIIHVLQNNMTESIMLLDDCDKIMLANDSIAEVLGINRALTDSHSIFTLTDHNNFLELIRVTKAEGYVRKIITIDGQDYSAIISRISLTDRNGTIVLLIDVTESVKAERIRREFTANVSHELKTPLTVIKGFGEMFGSGMIKDPEDIQRYGNMIQRESQRLLFLMNDIIRLSEIEERIEKNMQPVELSRIASECAEFIKEKSDSCDVSVSIIKNESVWIMGNESYIRELIINLIDNAVKYNNPRGWVHVNAYINGDKACISVEDNGIGIPKSSHDRIFERFYRVDKSRSKEREGTGLGLSIVKHIVEYHSGKIELESSPGKGTRITVKFAALQAEETE